MASLTFQWLPLRGIIQHSCISCNLGWTDKVYIRDVNLKLDKVDWAGPLRPEFQLGRPEDFQPWYIWLSVHLFETFEYDFIIYTRFLSFLMGVQTNHEHLGKCDDHNAFNKITKILNILAFLSKTYDFESFADEK